MTSDQAQDIAKTIAIIASVSSEIAVGKTAKMLAPADRQSEWEKTLAKAEQMRDAATIHLATLLERYCVSETGRAE